MAVAASIGVHSPGPGSMENPPRLPPVAPSADDPLRTLAASALAGTRHAIDRVDDAVVALAALRRHLVGAARHSKHLAGLPLRDGEREQQVRLRARTMAARVAVPGETADALMQALITDACRQQARSTPPIPRLPLPVIPMSTPAPPRRLLLRLLPPPPRWKPLLQRLPRAIHAPLAVRALGSALSRLDADTLEIVRDRRLGIEVSDLGLSWVLCWNGSGLQACPQPPEASVRGSATDLMLLASRLEDADTLFFQRRLILTGDTELGLTVRNLLDRLPWEDLPLAQRIVLQRGSRLLRAAREQHHGGGNA